MVSRSVRLKTLLNETARLARERGLARALGWAARKVISWAARPALCRYYALSRSSARFTMQSRPYRYFFHVYNRTWTNERTVEIPIIRDLLLRNRGKAVLEVGNVLSHYFPVDHDIVDKYERRDGVINEDAASFQSSKKYGLIVSISTLEHIGYDETPRDPGKTKATLDNLRRLLQPGGILAATVPLGYNPAMDAELLAGGLGFTRTVYMRRVTSDNRWTEAIADEVRHIEFGRPFPFANAIAIGIIEAEGIPSTVPG